MKISTVSFNKARVCNNRIYLSQLGQNYVRTKVFSTDGKYLLGRVSHSAEGSIEGDTAVITRKREYELPQRGIIFETVSRIYDSAGKLRKITKSFQEY